MSSESNELFAAFTSTDGSAQDLLDCADGRLLASLEGRDHDEMIAAGRLEIAHRDSPS